MPFSATVFFREREDGYLFLVFIDKEIITEEINYMACMLARMLVNQSTVASLEQDATSTSERPNHKLTRACMAHVRSISIEQEQCTLRTWS